MIKKEQIFLFSLWLIVLSGLIFRFSILGAQASVPEKWLGIECVRLAIAFLFFIALTRVKEIQLKKWARMLMIVGVGILLAMQFGLAHTVNNASRWIDLGLITFQPAEFIKVILLIYLADYLARRQKDIKYFWKGTMPVMLILAVLFLLVVLQPDFGTSVLLLSLGVWMIFLAGCRIKHLLIIGSFVFPLVVWFVFSSDYRVERLNAWLNPSSDLQHTGYQVNQAKWSIREGGLWGKGLMQGDARHGYLPESSSDFIGALWIEEFGLIGFLVLMALYVILIYQMSSVALKQQDLFSYLLCVGACFLLASQILINLGVITGLFPNKGIPLPLMSSGGSSLVTSACLLGLVYNRLKQSKELESVSEMELKSRHMPKVWNGL